MQHRGQVGSEAYAADLIKRHILHPLNHPHNLAFQRRQDTQRLCLPQRNEPHTGGNHRRHGTMCVSELRYMFIKTMLPARQAESDRQGALRQG